MQRQPPAFVHDLREIGARAGRRGSAILLTALIACGAERGDDSHAARGPVQERAGAASDSKVTRNEDEDEARLRWSRRSLAGRYTTQPIVVGSTTLELHENGCYTESTGNCSGFPILRVGTWEVEDARVVLREQDSRSSAPDREYRYLVMTQPDGRIALVNDWGMERFGLQWIGMTLWLRREEPSDYWSRILATSDSR